MRIVRLAAAAAICAGTLGAVVVAAPAKKDGGDKVICREMGETGSRLGAKRVCLTRDQWRQQKEAQRTDLEKAQRIRVGPDGG
jgi:hypothetical protein